MTSIHDNKILSVEFFPSEAKLIMKTKCCIDNKIKHVNIIFFDVYAYNFNEVGEENVIDEIAENTVLSYLNWYYSNRNIHRQSVMEYGFPLPFADKTSAINVLSGAYKYYEINARIGMDGLVIAKKMEIE